MNTFLRFLFEFISIFFEGFFSGLKGFVNGIKQMFSFTEYGKIIDNYKNHFNGQEKIFVVLSIIVLAIIIAITKL